MPKLKLVQNDLQKFELFFGLTPAKRSGEHLEFRVKNLDGCKVAAEQIIIKNKLNLKIEVSGNMATIGAFHVKYKDE